jgi:VCBS repeat-containing protein
VSKTKFFTHLSINQLPIILGVLLFVASCVGGEGGKKQADCDRGQVFDSVSRSCKGAVVTEGAPVPTLSATSILEDSGANAITLSYVDSSNDFATSCSVSADTSLGIVKKASTQGLFLQSRPDILDSHNTRISFTSGVALNVTTNTLIASIRAIDVTVTPTTTTLQVVSVLNAHPTASTWLVASALANQLVAPAVAIGLNEVDCTCFGGVCTTQITPADNYFGLTEFTYQLRDNDGLSATQIVRLNITSVNDDPVIALTGSIAATERFDSDTTTFSTGNLFFSGIMTANDTADGDPFGATLSVELVSGPGLGTLSIDSSGNYAYYTYAQTVSDSFIVRVVDPNGGVSPNITIPIVVTPVNDAPVGTLATITNFDEDGTSGLLTLTYSDEEGDSASRCVISSVSKVYPDGGCFCAAGVCRVIVRGLPDNTGIASFGYQIFDAGATPPIEKLVSFSLNSVADLPIVFPSAAGTSIQVVESDTFAPTDYTFTLDGAVDGDSNTIINYTLQAAPSNGTVTNCLGQGSSGLNCTYTPVDGNLADATTLDGIPASTDLSRVSTDSGTFYASTLGDTYNGVSIELVNIRNTDEAINTLFGANARVFANNSKVVILFQAGLTTGNDIQTAIAADAVVSKLIQFDPLGVVQNTAGTFNLASGVATADSFTVAAMDSSGQTGTQVVHISIIPTNDRPTLCEYSSYADTKVCGLNGCIGTSAPTGIVPDLDGLTFYSSQTGACYQSSGGVWAPVESFIADRSINELDPIVIDKIKVDEGGGAPEDVESLTITDVDSSDENLVPLGNIEIFYNNLTTPLGTGASAPFALTGSGGASADLNDMKIIITPQTINPPVDEKSSEIEITVADSTGRTTEVTFTVTVQKVSATHGGWVAFKGSGPKVDALGLVNEARTVCPYSLDLCEGGTSCFGTSTPVGNTSADPDHEDAIFMQEVGTTLTCYRQRRNQIQNIAYVGKTSNVPTIEYVEGTGGASNSATVSVTDNAITVTMYDDVTTTDTIVSAIESNASANALVKAINLKSGETQDNQNLTTLTALSNSSWETFETYCNATPAALETGCALGARSSRKSCMGAGSPVGVITPSLIDSRYWDEQNNVCYRSTGTTAASWQTYDAPAEVKISWNQFSINGSASVSEYKVFRRLAGEQFDFSLPINRKTISGVTSTFSFTDGSSESVVPPAPGTVYYYAVRPVVNSILTSTAAETGTNAIGVVRMVAPPKNMAFAHRWMINKQICSVMNLTTDATNNYRCSYKGAGDTTDGGSQFYDYGKDMLVDRFEAGCPYSPAPNCSGTFDNSCVGVNDPTTAGITPTSNLIYYSRSEGKCYMANGAAWNELDSAVFANYFANVEPDTTNLTADPQFDSNTDKQYHRSSLPPLTNISQSDANDFCSRLENLPANEILGVNTILSHRLPGRKEQVAYSLWDTTELNDNQIATLETGLSLNSNSKCNSSGSSGLEDGFVDFDKPDSNDFYSLPGTDSSNIRSITTGSNETASCTSSFGVQDAVGNVAEWTQNGINCPLMSQCFTKENLVIQDIEYVKVRPAADGLAISVLYVFGDAGVASISVVGGSVTIDLGDLGTPDATTVAALVNGGGGPSFLSARVVGTAANDQFPFGAAASLGAEVNGSNDTNFISSDTTDDYGFWSFDGLRGPCVDANSDTICDSALSSWALEDERFNAGRFMTPMGLPAHISANSTFNTDYNLFEIGPTSGITSLQLHDDTVNINSQIIGSQSTGCGGMATGGSYLSGNGAGVWNLEAVPCTDAIGSVTIQDVTFRANSVADLNVSIQIVENNASVTGAQRIGNTLFIDIAETGAIAANVMIAAVGEGTFDAFVSGDPTNAQAAFATAVNLDDHREAGKAARVDVGFRCMMEINDGSYVE